MTSARRRPGRSLLSRIRRLALARGLGKSNAWLAVGAAAWGLQTLKRLAAKEPKIVYSETLRPGERLVISHLPPDS
ncbi:MAG TPA: hypothetical protein VM942_04770 [Acidimicrobiales bacterium]|nr:hypothetical protein [Acidimicrobiales bacterium]